MTNKIALLCSSKSAIPSLLTLQEANMLCAVGMPDRKQEANSVIKELTTRNNIPYTVINKEKRSEQLKKWVTESEATLVLVIGFPWRITADILDIPEKGFLNCHFGPLPEMRGADPVFETIRRRKPFAGITIHRMDEGLDTGPVLILEKIPIGADVTYGLLNHWLSLICQKNVKQLVEDLNSGKQLDYSPQREEDATYWEKAIGRDMYIKWSEMDSEDIQALIKACNPALKGGVRAEFGTWTLGILDAQEVTINGDASHITPGTILALDKTNGLLVYCRNGKALNLEVVYTEEGILPGYKLNIFGLAPNMKFN